MCASDVVHEPCTPLVLQYKFLLSYPFLLFVRSCLSWQTLWPNLHIIIRKIKKGVQTDNDFLTFSLYPCMQEKSHTPHTVTYHRHWSLNVMSAVLVLFHCKSAHVLWILVTFLLVLVSCLPGLFNEELQWEITSFSLQWKITRFFPFSRMSIKMSFWGVFSLLLLSFFSFFFNTRFLLIDGLKIMNNDFWWLGFCVLACFSWSWWFGFIRFLPVQMKPLFDKKMLVSHVVCFLCE